MHVYRNLLKLKSQSKTFWAGIFKNVCGQFGHGTLKLTISEKKTWNKLIFYMLVQIQENLKLLNDFWMCMVKNGHGLLVLETLKSAYLKNEFMN